MTRYTSKKFAHFCDSMKNLQVFIVPKVLVIGPFRFLRPNIYIYLFIFNNLVRAFFWLFGLRTPPWIHCTVIVHKIILSKSTIPMRSISDKKSLVWQEEILRIILWKLLFLQWLTPSRSLVEPPFPPKRLNFNLFQVMKNGFGSDSTLLNSLILRW